MTTSQPFSVLMSVYHREDPRFLHLCLTSMLWQTCRPTQIVIVEDGPLTPGLTNVLDAWQGAFPGLFTRVALPENKGLGLALREGIYHCDNELIARMDTDDIAHPLRFEKQLELFENDPEIDICGSDIVEFISNPKDICSKRSVPLTHDAICSYQRSRSAFNHMTVMYKKTAVLCAGNYEHAPLMEDDMLWLNMIDSGARCANLDFPYVKARVGAGMFERRGGWEYFKKYNASRYIALQRGHISRLDYCKTWIVQFVVALIPTSLRSWVFTTLLR